MSRPSTFSGDLLPPGPPYGVFALPFLLFTIKGPPPFRLIPSLFVDNLLPSALVLIQAFSSPLRRNLFHPLLQAGFRRSLLTAGCRVSILPILPPISNRWHRECRPFSCPGAKFRSPPGVPFLLDFHTRYTQNFSLPLHPFVGGTPPR